MSFDAGDVLTDAVDRLTTGAGAVLVGGLALFGIVRTVAEQDIARALLEWVLAELDDPAVREELGPEEYETIRGELEAVLADLPLALGLSPGTAAVVWLAGYVLALVVTVVAIDAFGNEHDRIGALDGGRIGRHTLHLFVGSIVSGLLFVIGLVLFVIPGLVIGVLLVFFPAAIVLDDESFVAAFGSSVGVVRENVLGTLGIVVVGIVASFGIGIAATIVGSPLPGSVASVVSDLFGAVSLAFILALVARAYADGTADASVTETTDRSRDDLG